MDIHVDTGSLAAKRIEFEAVQPIKGKHGGMQQGMEHGAVSGINGNQGDSKHHMQPDEDSVEEDDNEWLDSDSEDSEGLDENSDSIANGSEHVLDVKV